MNTARAHEILHDHLKRRDTGDVKERCLLQDAIMCRSREEIRTFWESLDHAQKDTFTWLTFAVLSVESALEIFRNTAGRDALKPERDELTKEWDALGAAINAHNANVRKHAQYRKGFYKRLRDLDQDNAQLRQRAANAIAVLDAARSLSADRLRRIRALEEELKTHRALAAAIQAVLPKEAPCDSQH